MFVKFPESQDLYLIRKIFLLKIKKMMFKPMINKEPLKIEKLEIQN